MSADTATTIEHRIGGAPTAGDSTRRSPVWNPRRAKPRPRCCWPSRAMSIAPCRRQGGVHELERGLAGPARARHVRVPGARRPAHRRARAADRLRARQGRRGRQGRGHPRARGRRVRLRPPAAAQGRVLRSGLHRCRCALLPPAARRLRRDHAVQLPGDGPDVDAPGRDRDRQHVRAQAVRARSLGIESDRRAVRARRACPTASSTSCTATRWRSTRCSITPTWPRSRSSARRRSRKLRPRARDAPPASASRRSAGRRTTPS